VRGEGVGVGVRMGTHCEAAEDVRPRAHADGDHTVDPAERNRWLPRDRRRIVKFEHVIIIIIDREPLT